MALNWKDIAGSFDDTLYNAILKLEVPHASDRLNGELVEVKEGVFNFTIGVGVDLVAGLKPAQDTVLKKMGFKAAMVALNERPRMVSSSADCLSCSWKLSKTRPSGVLSRASCPSNNRSTISPR